MNSPDPSKIPKLDDLLGASVMMISVSYKNNEYFRCSYFVYNNVKDDIPVVNDQVDINLIYRTFLTDKPRIMVRDIDWEVLNK